MINLQSPNAYANKQLNVNNLNYGVYYKNGVEHWNPKALDPINKLKFISIQNLSLFSSVSEIKKYGHIPSDLSFLGTLPNLIPLVDTIQDYGWSEKANWPNSDEFKKIMSKTLNVDGKTIHRIFREGKIYWNYDINNIRLSIESANKHFIYFTSIEKVKDLNTPKGAIPNTVCSIICLTCYGSLNTRIFNFF